MCTSIIRNGKKTIVGWNLDILDMEYKIISEDNKVYIAIYDEKEGWLPLFGANSNGNFVAMPTCWPYDDRSDPKNNSCYQIIPLDIDLLICKKSLNEIKDIAEKNTIYSIPGVTFQSQLTDKEGNVLQITPGQGYNFIEKPKYSVMTNFSPFKANKALHPWMGLDRYNIAKEMLEHSNFDFDVADCFEILKATSQTICPTVASMVFDVSNNIVYWCELQKWNEIEHKNFLSSNI